MKLAGASNYSMHVLSLLWSVVLSLSVYVIMAKRFGEKTALIGLLILLSTHEFFAASTFVLNDIMLGWLSLLAIHFYTERHIRITALVLTALLLTKESGIVVCLVIYSDAIWHNRKQPSNLLPLWPVFILPAAIFSTLLIIQKYQLGWFFYPNHVDLIAPGLQNTLAHMQTGMRFLFFENGAWLPCVSLGVLATIAFLKTRQRKYLAVPLYLIMLFANLLLFSHKDAVFYAFLAGSVLLFIRYIPKISISTTPENNRFLRISLATTIFFLYFCCINFFETRYLFPCLLFIQAILLPTYLQQLIKKARMSNMGYAFLLAIPLLLATYNRNFVEYDRMWVHKNIAEFMENHNLYSASICSPLFFERIHLTDPKTGYRSTNRTFTHISENIENQTQLLIVDNIETPELFYPPNFCPDSFRLAYTAKRGDVIALVYQRR